MTLAQQDPGLASLVAEIKAAEGAIAASLADLHVYIGQRDQNRFARTETRGLAANAAQHALDGRRRSREHFSHRECSSSMDSRSILSADQSRAARAILNWSRVRLAAKANLSEMTIGVLENGVRKPRPHNIAAIRQALEDAGIVFTVEGTPTLARSDDSVLPTEDRMWR